MRGHVVLEQASPWADVSSFLHHIASFPELEAPEAFGLHANADLTYRMHQASSLLATLAETQPRQGTDTAGRSVEEVVMKISSDLLARLPQFYVEVGSTFGWVTNHAWCCVHTECRIRTWLPSS